MKRLYRRRRNTFLGPKAGNENLLASAFFDRGDKVFVVPRVHGRTLDGFLSWDTARSCGHVFPPKDFISTVVKTTGTSNTFATLAAFSESNYVSNVEDSREGGAIRFVFNRNGDTRGARSRLIDFFCGYFAPTT